MDGARKQNKRERKSKKIRNMKEITVKRKEWKKRIRKSGIPTSIKILVKKKTIFYKGLSVFH